MKITCVVESKALGILAVYSQFPQRSSFSHSVSYESSLTGGSSSDVTFCVVFAK